MTTDAITIDGAGRPASSDPSRIWTAALWLGQFAVAVILGMGAFVKFFNYVPEGSMDLAVALGALLAAFTMLGALFSHAVKLGWSGNAAAEMWPLALVVLAEALLVLYGRRSELPLLGRR